jgi:DNA-binding winged helix-turn-helix (wHTH) protein
LLHVSRQVLDSCQLLLVRPMISHSQSEQRIRFGEFELDPSTRELKRNGDTFDMQEQPFQVLLMLLERPGQLITREELIKRLWPADTFVDFEHSLNKAVNRLREILNDSSDTPQFVETLPRRGYRFIGPVEHVGDGGPVHKQAAASDSRVVPSKSLWKLVVLVAGAALLATAAATYCFWARSKASLAPAKITQISQWNKPMYNARLSPDGHAVAFLSPAGGISQVFVMLTSGGEPLQLTDDESDKFVDSFSADGKEVYYGIDPRREEVWALPALGGSPRHVASAIYVLPSPDGTSLFYVKPGNSAIFRVGKSGLDEELVYKPEDNSLVFFWLLLFPGGNDLLAGGLEQNSPNVRIFRINLTSHDAVDLGEMHQSGDVVWAEPGIPYYSAVQSMG